MEGKDKYKEWHEKVNERLYNEGVRIDEQENVENEELGSLCF